MLPMCPICKKQTKRERAIHGGEILEDYVCENCNIAWYIDLQNEMKIRVSSTHSIASKLKDEEFKELLNKIEKFEKGEYK